MAPRPFWTGHLKLSLVTCAVSMTPATTETDRIHFHMMNRKTGHRVVVQYVDAVTGRAVADDDLVKGFPRGGDRFVLLEDDELDAVALESTRTIDIERFVDIGDIGWLWYDTPHYLVPDEAVGEEAFAVIRDAMHDTGTVGIARLVLYRREHAVLLEPRGKGIVVWTLRYGDEVRDPPDYPPTEKAPEPQRPDLVPLDTLISERLRPWSPEMIQDPVEAHLQAIIDAKKRARKKPAKSTPPAPDQPVVNIMDALKASLKSSAKDLKS
ncbi:Ku protein [Gluconacetobacter sacchari DSM 12717]|uniref:Non-homologous end joining protein Ku n=2 Tax=Gluconacetobacter sacchari TaxID=92759 RepID=A0A7W4IGK7_9PROT|nr:Ku protein [Gluconacetobacter sacchari]MBB2162500.1 Ku protein [Gluconacetobacter sacchari]GBQ32581.1 Ku protein [Gluconacetobacter sacchari DSM 12717]